jgi:ribonuclease D
VDNETPDYTFIEDFAALKDFADLHKTVKWICFDTEFMGEKRFVTLLCLIQIASEHGYYLIDSIKIKDLSPLIELIEDEHITKITHAGDNDFRLFNILFGSLPKNVFDTQMAAGFVGYKYPVSFQKLLDSELNVRVGKGFTVTDWSKRPFSPKQIKYALNDVIYLYDLWQSLAGQLREAGRQTWVEEECEALEKAAYYAQSPYKEAFNSNIIQSLQSKQQLFLIRLYAWRTDEARAKNYSREMILPGKLIGAIIRAASGGRDALRGNRRLPERTIARHGETFLTLYNQEPTPEELKVLDMIPRKSSEHPQQDIVNEMLHLLIKYKCFEENLSINLAMPRTMLKKLKADKNYFEDALETGWRKEFLGEEIITWLKFRNDLKLRFGEGKFELTLD